MRLGRLAASLAALTLSVTPALADAPAPPAWKNLQILPKTMPKDELKAYMKGMSKSLGVECDHCHEPPDMAKDTPKKETARQMMRMTSEINEKFIKDPKAVVTCATCHRGKEAPEVLGKK